ncbi:hypothetical protein D9615_010118 [Tricholomella constricta]|uniref:Nucleoporin n=1 Tax=Tricholomella constricta TaxID=117010 RepID=A0A8H5LX54_9AGAR|nr:hypothetical protein D9615_010118 [Tricholomella constricta]
MAFASGSSAFGAAQNNQSNLFGAPKPAGAAIFGAPQPAQQQTATGGLFGQQQQPTGGLFGQPAQQQQQPVGLFGQSTQQQPTNTLFGQSIGQQPQQQQQQQQQTGGLFGQSTTQPAGGGLFGQSATQPAAGVFGQSTAQPAGGGLFGQSATQPTGGGLFGQSTMQPAGGGIFSQTTTQPAGGLFGQTTQQQPQQQQSGGLFGNALQAQPTIPTGGFGGGLFGNTQQQQQQQQNLGLSNATQASNVPLFSKSTKFNDLSDEIKRTLESIESGPDQQGLASTIHPFLVVFRILTPIILLVEDLVYASTLIRDDLHFTKGMKAKVEQAVQDTIVATRIVDAFKAPQGSGSGYLKDHPGFPLEFFTRATENMKQRLAWYKSTIEPPISHEALARAVLSDIVTGLDVSQIQATSMQTQCYLRHAMAETVSEGIINCLIITNSSDANVQLTRIHEHIFLRDPTVASVWRRQTFTAAVDTCTPEMSLSILYEQIPELMKHLNGALPSSGGSSILEHAYSFSRMLHGSSSSSSGDAFYRAFVPEMGSTLYPRQIELVKRCLRSERGELDRVGATIFPGLVKVTRGPPLPSGLYGENVQTVVRRAQVICECAIGGAPVSVPPSGYGMPGTPPAPFPPTGGF